jgi:hypothetical protein
MSPVELVFCLVALAVGVAVGKVVDAWESNDWRRRRRVARLSPVRLSEVAPGTMVKIAGHVESSVPAPPDTFVVRDAAGARALVYGRSATVVGGDGAVGVGEAVTVVGAARLPEALDGRIDAHQPVRLVFAGGEAQPLYILRAVTG